MKPFKIHTFHKYLTELSARESSKLFPQKFEFSVLVNIKLNISESIFRLQFKVYFKEVIFFFIYFVTLLS